MKFNLKKYVPLICKTLIIGLTEAGNLEEEGINVKVRDTVRDRYYWPGMILTDAIDLATGLYSSSKADEDYYIVEGGE
ncbi:MAG: hypothetical protein IJM98_08725 [Oscillospiraceae bacterium]|nr:hypothetical protein [Oscillospiraceae bacterium]